MILSGTVKYHDSLEPLMRPIDSVQQHPENYNNGDVDALMESIETSGMYRPLYVQKSTGRIIAGNHTWLACKELGAEQVPVVEVDVDDTKAKRILVADNRIAQLAKPDDGQLIALLESLQEEDQGLRGTGFADHDLEALRLLQEKLSGVPMGFPEVPPDMETTHKCPSCGYEWNGVAHTGE